MTPEDAFPFAARWPDGGSAGRYSSETAAGIKAASISGTYAHEPRETTA